jgi:hypothetical protein
MPWRIAGTLSDVEASVRFRRLVRGERGRTRLAP